MGYAKGEERWRDRNEVAEVKEGEGEEMELLPWVGIFWRWSLFLPEGKNMEWNLHIESF